MRHMKTERENYLKPQTIMEQVAMEQGICAGSIENPIANDTKVKAMDHTTGFDGTYQETNSPFSVEWN